MFPRFRSVAVAAIIAASVPSAAWTQTFWSNVPMPDGTSTGGADCSPQVQQHQDQLAQSSIAGRVNIANSAFTPMTKSFSQMSCLNNILNFGGLNLLLSPPSLDSIINALINQACTIMQGYVNQGESMLNGVLSQAESAPGSLASGLPGYLPGVSMGSILSAQVGNTGGGMLRTNLTQSLNNGYVFTPQPYDPNTFGGGLFNQQ